MMNYWDILLCYVSLGHICNTILHLYYVVVLGDYGYVDVDVTANISLPHNKTCRTPELHSCVYLQVTYSLVFFLYNTNILHA